MRWETSDPIVSDIATFFEERTGQRLKESRLWRVETTLGRVMRDHGLDSLADLLAALRRDGNGPIASATIHGLMNHESFFFRDINVFDMIEREVLPHLNQTLPERTLRIWCAGCSTGQEAYSLAIILKRQQALWDNWRVSILGTDISPFAIATAQKGQYQQMDVQRGLPIAELLRWFEPHDEYWQIDQRLQSMVSFRADNLLEPRAASGFFDLILCRNVMLYFTRELRGKAMRRLAERSRADSILFLGAGETTIGASNLFVPCGTFRAAYRPAPASIDRLAS